MSVCEDGNETSGSIRREFIIQSRLLNKDPVKLGQIVKKFST